jgi:hypothetical protein
MAVGGIRLFITISAMAIFGTIMVNLNVKRENTQIYPKGATRKAVGIIMWKVID